jgi:energy-coupling factor transport system permease protein
VTRPAIPRPLHPGAWWLWALGLATAASTTNNLLLLALLVAVAGYVVAARRTSAPWSRAFRAALILGAVVIVVRLAFEVVFGTDAGPTVLVDLPQVPLPGWAAGVELGGAVTLEGMAAALRDGSQIAAMIACVGAANALANPSRLLKAVPGALYEVGVSVVVALTVAPQAVEDVQRRRRARRLRGRPDQGLRGLGSVALPALEGALQRSLQLAASMDARGYGRRAEVSRRSRRLTATLVLGGLMGVVLGLYGLLDAGSPTGLGLALVIAGTGLAAVGFRIASHRSIRTHYRPDPWLGPEWITVASGAVPALALIIARAAAEPGLLVPASPLAWPTLPLLPALAILVGLVPAWATPPQEASTASRAKTAPHDLPHEVAV